MHRPPPVFRPTRREDATVPDLGDFSAIFAHLALIRSRIPTPQRHVVEDEATSEAETSESADEADVDIKQTDFAHATKSTTPPKNKKRKKRVRIVSQPAVSTRGKPSRPLWEDVEDPVQMRRRRSSARLVRTSSASDSATVSRPMSNGLTPPVAPEVYQSYGLPLSGPDKSTSLMDKIASLFPNEDLYRRRNIFLPNPPSLPAPTDDQPSVFVFVDHSNVHLGFLHHLKSAYPLLDLRKFKRARPALDGDEPRQKARRPRLDYDSLFAVLERGRRVVHRYLAASRPLYQHLDVAASRGYEVQLMERVWREDPSTPVKHAPTESDSEGLGASSGAIDRQILRLREQGLDEIIQLAIVDAVEGFDWDRRSAEEKRPRPILVLASGDANAGEYSKTGFRGRVSKCLRDGWDVEVYGWSGSISRWYFDEQRRTSAQEGAGRLRVVKLDDFARELLSDEA